MRVQIYNNLGMTLWQTMALTVWMLIPNMPCDDPEIQAVIKELNRNLLNNYNNLIKELQNFTAE